MKHIISVCAVVLCLFPIKSRAQIYEYSTDPKTIAAVAANTAAAYAWENGYRINADTILMRSSSILASALIKQQMKNFDMEERQKLRNLGRDGMAYYMLVDETAKLVAAAVEYIRHVKEYPHNSFTCYKDLTMVMLEAKGLVKNAVVVGMGGKVPNPFKVDRDKLFNGTDNTPAYEDDADSKDRDGKVVTDGDNLLLPDERYRIVNHTINKLRKLTLATITAANKLKYDYGWRKKMWEAPPYMNYRVENVKRAVNRVVDDLDYLMK